MSDKPDELDMDLIARINIDLTERLFSEGVTIAYDEDGDTLFLTIGRPHEAISEVSIGWHGRNSIGSAEKARSKVGC